MTTEGGCRLQPEIHVRCDARQSGPAVTLAQADGRAVRDTAGRPDPAPPGHVAARRTDALHESHRCRHRGRGRGTRGHRPGTPDVHTGQWTADRGHHMRGHWTFTPDTGHRTRGRDRVLGQGDLDTAGTGQTSRTTEPPDRPLGRRVMDLWTAPAALGNDDGSAREVPASARLPTALPGACSVALSAKPRPGALLSSDDCGSSVKRTAKLHPLWQAPMRVGA